MQVAGKKRVRDADTERVRTKISLHRCLYGNLMLFDLSPPGHLAEGFSSPSFP